MMAGAGIQNGFFHYVRVEGIPARGSSFGNRVVVVRWWGEMSAGQGDD